MSGSERKGQGRKVGGKCVEECCVWFLGGNRKGDGFNEEKKQQGVD